MAADRENGGSQTANEVPADTERQQGLRDLQDTVTASYVPDASPENTNGIADTEQNAQPAADSDIQPVWSASATRRYFRFSRRTEYTERTNRLRYT